MKFQNDFQYLILVGSLFVLPACMEIRAVDKDDAAPVEQVQVASIQGEFRLRPLDWNRYEVTLNDSASLWEREEVLVDPKDGRKVQVVTLPRLEGGARDLVEGGRTYRYAALDAATGRKTSDKIFEVAVPLDLKIDSEVFPSSPALRLLFEEASKRPRIGRLHFTNKGILTTQGRDVDWKIQSLHSEGGVIRSFAPGAKAFSASDQDVHGGRIAIEAEVAEGLMHFELRGKHGADGKAGAPPTPDFNGRNGADGKYGKLKILLSSCDPKHRICPKREPTCSEDAVHARNGWDGRTGNPGENGGRGGDSAELVLKVLDSARFQARMTSEEGRGGVEGKGGLGGQGGQGGAGAKDPNEIVIARCLIPNAGLPGAPGKPGKDGVPGANGIRRMVKVWENGQFVERR